MTMKARTCARDGRRWKESGSLMTIKSIITALDLPIYIDSAFYGNNKFPNFQNRFIPNQCGSAGCHPTNKKVTGSIPSQDTCLGCRFGPWSGHIGEATHPGFFLSFSLPSRLSKSK